MPWAGHEREPRQCAQTDSAQQTSRCTWTQELAEAEQLPRTSHNNDQSRHGRAPTRNDVQLARNGVQLARTDVQQHALDVQIRMDPRGSVLDVLNLLDAQKQTCKSGQNVQNTCISALEAQLAAQRCAFPCKSVHIATCPRTSRSGTLRRRSRLWRCAVWDGI